MWDLVLHIKTPPDIGNKLHLFTPYQERIEATYLRGKQETPLVRLNRKDVDAPYLIINGNLVNRGRPRAFESESDRPYRDNYNFEFTRAYTGSDGLGYIQSAGFGLPVVQAQTAEGGPAWFNPRKVVVEDLTEGTCHKPRAERIRPDACVRLSQAMTASGAGLDVDSLVEEWYRDDFARLGLRLLTAPLNVNNEYQAWNYARRYNTTIGTIWDYFLMVTIQRFFPDTKSRWIEITDGSFYDNLGTQTLLRRQVSHLIVGDATLDSTWQYDYLHHLQIRIKAYFGKGVEMVRRDSPEGRDRVVSALLGQTAGRHADRHSLHEALRLQPHPVQKEPVARRTREDVCQPTTGRRALPHDASVDEPAGEADPPGRNLATADDPRRPVARESEACAEEGHEVCRVTKGRRIPADQHPVSVI